MANPIAAGLCQFVDNRGNLLSNGSVSLFYPGTTTPKPTWRDPDLTVPNTNPVQLDGNGRAPIFGKGRYRQQVRAANNTLLFDAETQVGPDEAPLATDITNMTFASETKAIRTSGFSAPGKGAASYTRLDTAPDPTEAAAGLGRWLFKSNGNTVWWRLSEQVLTDLMYGVQASAVATAANGVLTVTGPDDTAALQSAIDHVLYFSQGTTRRLRLPAGIRRITDTIHIGYGHRYVDWHIDGDFTFGYNVNEGYHAGIYATFNDRPAINIQGARNSRLSGISVYGANHAYLDANRELILDRSNLASWFGNQMRPATTDTRYAPYCGVAVDGYGGARQVSSSYPDATYPAWLPGQTQYQRGLSSSIEFVALTLAGFEAGLAIQPNLMPTNSNGDFMSMTSCDFSLNVVGVTVSHSDARVVAFDRSRFHFCRTAFDSLSYGSGAGNVAASFSNCSFDHAYKVMNVDLGIAAQPFAATITFTNMYGEAMYSLGTVRSAAATGMPGAVRFIGGEMGFFVRANEHTPFAYLAGRGEVVARFEDVSIHDTYGIFPLDCEVAHFSASFPRISQHAFDQTTLGGRRAAVALCGLDAPKVHAVLARPFILYGLDNAAQFGMRIASHGWDRTGGGVLASTMHVPLHVRSVDCAGQAMPIASAPMELLDRGLRPLINPVRSGREWTFSVDGSFLSDVSSPGYCLGRGDIVRDRASGILYYVKAVAFSGSAAQLQVSLTLVQITGVRSSNGTDWSAAGTLDAGAGVLEFRNARRVLAGATRPLAMATSEGSGTASFVAIGPETFAADDFGPVVRTMAAGDYLLSALNGAPDLDASVFPKGTVLSVQQNGSQQPTGQVVFDAAARRSGLWSAPIIVKAA